VSVYATAVTLFNIETEHSSLFIYTRFIYCQATRVDIFMQDIMFYHLLLYTIIYIYIYIYVYYNKEFYCRFHRNALRSEKLFIYSFVEVKLCKHCTAVCTVLQSEWVVLSIDSAINKHCRNNNFANCTCPTVDLIALLQIIFYSTC